MPAGDGGLDRVAVRDRLAEAVREAGALALQTFRGTLKSWIKGKSSPVSEADLAVDRFLRGRLLAILDVGWLSEETEDDPDRLQRPSVWIVDPIDGTRAYLEGLPDWAVSAALVSEGRPVIAALYAPVSDELFLSVAGGGATLNGTPIRASTGGSSPVRDSPGRSVASKPSPRSSRASRRCRAFLRWRCASRGLQAVCWTAPSSVPTVMIGILRQPIFWCTKPVGG